MCSLLLLETSRLAPYTPPATDAGDDFVDSRPTKMQEKTFTDTEVPSPLSVVGVERLGNTVTREEGGCHALEEGASTLEEILSLRRRK